MCLILVAHQPKAPLPLVIIGNRDERYARPTTPAHWWPERDILGGRDEQSGGAWFAVNRSGRFAVVTNVREGLPVADPQARSRGLLVTDVLGSPMSLEQTLTNIGNSSSYSQGYNLLAGDATGVWWCSNRAPGPVKLEPGVHSLANGLLDTAWPKQRRTLPAFAAAVARDRSLKAGTTAYYDLLADEKRSVFGLPDTGIGRKLEWALSAPFVRTPDFGTRASTVLRLRADGSFAFDERLFDHDGYVDEQSFVSHPTD